MENKSLKKKIILKKKVKKTISNILITIIIFLLGMITVKINPMFKNTINEKIYEKSLKFTKVKQIYKKYFGNILSLDNIIYEETPVFNEKITYSKSNKYKDGVELTVGANYMVPCIGTGIVIYIGNKEEYGKTIIVEQTDGVDVFYSNITTDNIKLYDYIEKGEYIGQTINDKLYLTFQKSGETLNYKDYI